MGCQELTMTSVPFDFQELDASLMQERAAEFKAAMTARRTVREFSSRPLPEGVLEQCLQAAGSAPSGANRQPWHFCVVREPLLKARIRRAAELEEEAFYSGRAPQEWLAALAPLATDQHKPFLETAPALIVIFAENHGHDLDGSKVKNYYVTESVGIATGMLITALHWSGLACLTHTPSPMGFLRDILGRPENERAYLILVVGYPAPGVRVPEISRKDLGEISTFL
jgi:nitroreductase